MDFAPDDELAAELRETFAVEAAEHLGSLDHALLELERSGSPEESRRLLKEIFRNAHTLKGGAAVVGLQDVKLLAHLLESIFAGMQNDEIATGPELFDTLYRTVDTIGRLIQEPADVSGPGEVGALAEQLTTIVPEGGTLTPPGPEPPTREPLEPSAGQVADESAEVHGFADHQDAAHPRSPAAGGGDTVRVATSKLDDLMAQVGELVVAGGGAKRTSEEVGEIADLLAGLTRSARDASNGASHGDGSDLTEVANRVERLHHWIKVDERRMDQVTGQLQDSVRRARMLPVSTILDGFPRMVRDLARSQNKKVRLEIRGGDTELDRAILEQVKDPLIHILRNCVDHGLEEPETRVGAGKPPEGTIVLRAEQKGDTVLVEVADDGAGIDLERVRRAAVEKGGVRADDVHDMGEHEMLSLIFRSGLSTSPLITSVSGRGVGLDVVRENVERLHGTIEVSTDPGRGTTFSLVMPLTVTTTRCVLVRAGSHLFGVPLNNVVRSERISPGDVREAEGSEAIALPGGPVPLRDLASVLGLDRDPWRDGLRPVLVARAADRRVGLLVDDVEGIEEVVVKSLPSPLVRVRHAAGASVLGTGQVVVVLNVADVVRSAVRSGDAAGPRARERRASDEVRRGRILLADDSITSRTLERNILSAAGYEVRVAVDGADAWRQLAEELPDILVSDVQMPGMDGFELTAKVRADERSKHLPVVLVTSLESESDRERGIDAGADAYIGKSSFDQDHLLDVVRRLI